MRLCLLLFLSLAMCCLGLPQGRAEDNAAQSKTQSPEAVEFFESKIRPLLLQHCVECHNDAEPESGLSLESYAGLMRGGKLGAAVTPGKPKESLLISAVNHDEFLKMPPKAKLSTVELVALSKWVAMGAPWPTAATTAPPPNVPPGQSGNPSETEADPLPGFTDQQKNFWAYQPIVRPAWPQATTADGQQPWQSPVDAFIVDQLQRRGIPAAGPATRRELLRRATFDLTGLPASEEEIAMFVTDAAPDAFARRLDRLLASPRYGEKWGRHWLDVARFAESNGLDENIAYANAFRYRDYVINSFNSDKPYDRFVQEQIAGDLLPETHGDGITYGDPFDRFVATGFLAIGAKMLAEDDPVKMQMDIIDEQLSVLCQAFMGVTIGCARCHDHKFDPLPATDYYALAGIFKSTQTMENHKVVARWFERPLASPELQARLREIDQQIATTQAELDKLNQQCAQRVAKEFRSSVAAALKATLAYQHFSRQSSQQLALGVNHTDDQGPGFQPQKVGQPYAVDDGYALIEAEGYHRGSASRDYDQYGQAIGVIGSEGGANVEYDLQVQHAGTYAIEMRYAAAERRPLRMHIDGAESAARVASEITGSWHPDGQAWTIAGTVKLTEGKHVLRFDSRRVFPHIDKLAIVMQVDGQWPFGKAPVALSRSGIESGLPFPAIQMWRTYLSDIARGRGERSTDENLFALWLRLTHQLDAFEQQAEASYAELDGPSTLREQTPEVLRKAVLLARPKTVDELALVYQSTIQQILAEDEPSDDALRKLRDRLLAKASPLAGPKSDFERFYSVDERQQASRLEARLAQSQADRPRVPMAMGVTEATPENLKVHLRGSHLVLGKLVSRRMPHILARDRQPPIDHQGSGRLPLALWITHPDHPLTSRVMANRIWHWHFGRGIVPTTDNFGMLGLKPTHPELLDWLATEFMEHDWSIKHMHRTLMLSDVYQRSSKPADTVSPNLDAENEWLGRFRRRRLTAEETRDAMLAVGAGLDQTMYGSLMKTENHKYVNNTDSGGELNYQNARRSVYLPVIRSGVFDVLQTLDFPDPAMTSGERQTSTVAPQALLMMNSDLVHEQSLAVADQLLNTTSDDAARLGMAFRRILSRPPVPAEIASAATYLQRGHEQGTDRRDLWQGLCRVLISSNEFSYVD